MTSISAGIRQSSWRFIGAMSLFVMVIVAAINLSFRFDHGLYDAVYRATWHLVTPTLMAAGLMAVVIIGALVVGGRVSFRDFGWKRELLVPGLVATAALWAVMQAIEVVVQLATTGQFQFSPSWGRVGTATVIGVLLGQAFGTAAGEETFFRGFLLPQIYLRLGKLSRGTAIAAAIGLSQTVFALYHLPNLLLGNSGLGTGALDIITQLGVDLAIGVVFASLYIRTGNLFLVMGIHALQNAGTSVVATPIEPAPVMLGLAFLVLLATFAPVVFRRVRGRGTSTPLATAQP